MITRAFVIIALLVLLTPLTSAQATNVMVDNPGSGNTCVATPTNPSPSSCCTIFNALVYANSGGTSVHTNAGACGATSPTDPHTIEIQAGLGANLSHNNPLNVCYGKQITIKGNNNTITGNDTRQIFNIGGCGAALTDASQTKLTLNDVNLRDGRSAIGGAIRLQDNTSLAINRGVVMDNEAIVSGDQAFGGAIYLGSGADLNITNSVFSGNVADIGGAISFEQTSAATIVIENSVFTGNSVRSTPGNFGGAIRAVGAVTLNITNSTFSGNSSGNNSGGAISLGNNVTTTLTHVTISSNSGARGALHIIDNVSQNLRPNVSVRNSLIAGNTASTAGQPADCSSDIALTQNVGNIIQDGSAGLCSAPASGNLGIGPLNTLANLPYHPLLAGSPAIDAAACLSGVTKDQIGTTRDAICDIGAFEYIAPPPPPPPPPPPRPGPDTDSGSSSSSSSSASSAPQTTSSKSVVYTGEILQRQGYRLSATHGLRSGVQFQRLGAAGVGNQSVIDMGFLDAIDVWGYVEQGVEVCFPPERGSGGLMFLDAATSPRTVSPLASVLRDGYTCASINRPGTLVLVSNAPQPSQLPVPTGLPTTILSNCMVRTTAVLNFRDGPSGNLIQPLIPHNVTLTALERTAGWFKVDYHGARGWISAAYVEPTGDCSL